MRKILYIFLLVLIMSLCSCSNVATMTIKPTEFSKETQEVLEVLDKNIIFLDCILDETVKSKSINLWFYKDGEWVEGGRTYGNTKYLKSKIALILTEKNFGICDINENGHSKSTFRPETDFSKANVVVSSQLSSPTQITLNKEITLWSKLGTEKDSLSTRGNNDFRKTDCDAGIAITVTYSDKVVD